MGIQFPAFTSIEADEHHIAIQEVELQAHRVFTTAPDFFQLAKSRYRLVQDFPPDFVGYFTIVFNPTPEIGLNTLTYSIVLSLHFSCSGESDMAILLVLLTFTASSVFSAFSSMESSSS